MTGEGSKKNTDDHVTNDGVISTKCHALLNVLAILYVLKAYIETAICTLHNIHTAEWLSMVLDCDRNHGNHRL